MRLNGIVVLVMFCCLPAVAQDRYPRPGEPGAIGSPAGSPAPGVGPAGAVNQVGKPKHARPSPTRPSSVVKPNPQKQPDDPIARFESQDFGVRPVSALHRGAMHGDTPTTIPGGRVIGTQALSASMRIRQNSVYVFHVLGQGPMLPGAVFAAQASNPGSFGDQTQAQMTQYLQQLTRGNPNAMLVFYCSGPKCWMSYNAALRAINAGYRNVRWYRGGLQAWRMAGLPLQ